MPDQEATFFPEWVVPMAATLTQERFTGQEWIFERKFDGIRMLAFKNGSDVKLYSRNRLLQHYPAVADAIANLPVHDVILDGEAAWNSASRVAYHVFDILWLDGRSLMPLPLDARRALLHACALRAPLAHVPEITGDKPWERACSEGWEGVIAKRRTSPYEHRRSPHWLKMKCEASQELVVGGFTDPQGSRVGLGALLVGYFDRDDFVFAGKIGTGFDTKLLLDLRSRLDELEIPKSPFAKGKGLPRIRTHWVRPEIVVQVAFIEWTLHGKLRHPRLLGIRYDKSPREVVRETW
jgi:bifunctional non-homologous end joining protein LigD